MIRYTFPLLFLLFVLTVHGCAPFDHQKATPYRYPSASQQTAPQMKEKPGSHGTLPQQPGTSSQSSTVRDISSQAEQLMRQGQFDAAAQTLERGLRIAPKNAYLWSQLATVRLQQHRYGQAQSLAAKSSSLARGDAALVSRNQTIIEQAKW